MNQNSRPKTPPRSDRHLMTKRLLDEILRWGICLPVEDGNMEIFPGAITSAAAMDEVPKKDY